MEFDANPSTSGRSIVAYGWDLGDGRTASGCQITTSFQTAGSYTVSLTIADTAGRTSTLTEPITVYLRSGTEIFHEDFSSGSQSLDRWTLDPTWASETESSIEHFANDPGYVLHIRSGEQQWHRLYASVELPPLRAGQRLVFSCRAMTADNQEDHTFIFAPARREIMTSAGSLPYFQFTSNGGGAYVREPTAYGTDLGHPVAFVPDVYRWHTYTFSYDSESYELRVDDVLWQSASLTAEIASGGKWFVLLGEESSAEACNAYFDDIRVSIDE